MQTATTAEITLDFPELENSVRRKPRFSDYTVATILDDFSQVAWEHEFTSISLAPQNWEEEISTGIDLLFVESAWAGNKGLWRYKLTGPHAPALELRNLVDYCKRNSIPTIFWNKEDPPHFNDFLECARLFDYVFTSDSNKIPDYQKQLGHQRVEVLPFAAQDAFHNPIRPPHGFHERDIAFAGMYFAHKYPERRKQIELLLGAAYRVSSTMPIGIEIFSRFLGDDSRYQFPSPYAGRVVGSLSYPKMLTAYKAYKVFLNVNSVVDSPTMCARRIFEITASGTPVVSTPSLAIPNYFPDDEVPLVHSEADAQHIISSLVHSPELNDRTVHKAQRTIWKSHTYSHRASRVLSVAGIAPEQDRLKLPETSIIVSTNRPHQISHILSSVAAQRGVNLQLNLLTHGFEIPSAEIRAFGHEQKIDINLLHADTSQTLGQCLNELVQASDGGVVTKMDDDDYYGENYLQDLLFAQRFSGADIVGKQAHYMHLVATEATILRNPEREHRWTDFVMGPTLTGLRDIFLAHPFEDRNRGEDTAFLASVVSDGGKIYSSDRFNFLQMRGINHTWDIEDHELLSRGKVQFFGKGLEHMMF